MSRVQYQMTVGEREFWLMISAAAFSNPFSEQRYELDVKIAGAFEGETQRGELLEQSIVQRVQALETQGRAHLKFFSGRDREIMRTGFLFEVFHRFHRNLDGLISDQTKAGEKPCRVSFASEALA